MNLERLLVVESALPLPALGGVVVRPDPPASAAVFPSSRTSPGELRRPDGSTQSVTVTLQWTHLDPGGYRLVCVLLGVAADRVSAGSEVWCEPA